METTRSTERASPARSSLNVATWRVRPRSSASGRSSAMRSERLSTVTSCTPRWARPHRTGRAVPPAPMSSAVDGWDLPSSSSSAPRTPSVSVLSARHPSSVRTRVFAEPMSSARSLTMFAQASASNLSGMVTEKPRYSSPALARKAARSVTSILV